MFVGHYAASLTLKRVDKNASIGMLFLAVQFVDILFFPFGADVITMSVSALVMYFIFAGIAFWLDKKRS